MKEQIKKEHLRRSTKRPSADSHIRELDGVVIQVTQAFCPKGHNLVRQHADTFDGEFGIHLQVKTPEREGLVILSPFHGDHRRRGDLELAEGTRVEALCPVCRCRLPELADCGCRWGGKLFKLYTTSELSENHLVALCDVWGCHRSKVFDQAQLLSAYESR